jgi:hypothetical protein
MNRIMKFSIGTLAATSAAVGSVALTGAGAASAATITRHPAALVAACSSSVKNYALPKSPTSYRAGIAGSVTVATVNSGTIRVAGVHPARGWRASVDSSSGSSVDVYFRGGGHTVKFEAEINDWGALTVTITHC